MSATALWDRASDETREDFRTRRARGEALAAICSYGSPAAPLHATTWRAGAGGPDQRLETDIQAGYAAGVIARHARDGFHPALVALTGGPERWVMTLVLEPVRRGAALPILVTPRPLRDASGALFVNRATVGAAPELGFVRSIAIAGSPTNARGDGLGVAAVWCPQPAVHVAWAVHLDAVDPSVGSWRRGWEARTLETVARPVQAIPLTSADGRRWVVSLWHDLPLVPWPPGDPFARTERFTVDEDLGGADLTRALTRRRRFEDRSPIAIAAEARPSGPRFLALYGAAGDDPGPARRFVALGPRDDGVSSIPLDAAAGDPEAMPAVATHPLDDWALAHMRRTGARHGQLVVVRGRRLVFAKAYTFAEAGYPVARLDHAMRLGSVSKALTSIALLPALRRRGVVDGVDARIVRPDLLGVAADAGPPLLARVTLRHLLTHDAGLRTQVDVRPDRKEHPLGEHRLADALHGDIRFAKPGELTAALRILESDDPFFRPPGREGAGRVHYSNEGFILLGEILSQLELGRADGYELAVERLLLRAVGIDASGRGCLFGLGRARALARLESPAHPASPTWAANRFGGDDADEGPLVVAPYSDNGHFLGGAAGWCVPLVWLARVLGALGPRSDGSGLWERADADLAATTVEDGSDIGHGFHVGARGWWTMRRRGAGPSTFRVARLHHNGRLDGGSALLVHQMPCDRSDDALDATLSVAVAFNQLGPLYDEPHGRELFAILKQLEAADELDTEDLFDQISSSGSASEGACLP